MENAAKCWQQANELNELSRTDVQPPVAHLLRELAVTWKKLAGQLDRLAQRDPKMARRVCAAMMLEEATEPGKRVLWAKFTAPPDSVTRVSLLFPEAEPVDDVPISK